MDRNSSSAEQNRCDKKSILKMLCCFECGNNNDVSNPQPQPLSSNHPQEEVDKNKVCDSPNPPRPSFDASTIQNLYESALAVVNHTSTSVGQFRHSNNIPRKSLSYSVD
ncbi:hypothetical protein VNO78_07200 [Psophocarpus tetragonolobus]|uniref:Uncharacterized protein n=1 Tax=Psophocarpus tetragonolobus TaxID=3891 RepID=A0AAN9XRR4_PSOTE